MLDEDGFFISIYGGCVMDNQKRLMVKEVTGRELLTINEMSEMLKVKPSWLYFRTMQTGEDAIPRVRIGKYLRFNPDAVMTWIYRQYGDAEKRTRNTTMKKLHKEKLQSRHRQLILPFMQE